tara:strand:+ start:90 stop:356 length:267 start_codon:yes stop_codon:yes gene_type:complete
MNISANKTAVETIISLALLGTCPKNEMAKFNQLEKWAKTSKDKLLSEVETFLISEAERLIEDEAEFDRYYTRFINQEKAEKFLEETAP